MVKYLLTFAAALLLFAACQKEKEGIDSFPILVTNPMVDVDSSGITLNMAFTSKGSFKIQEAGFCIDEKSIKSFSQDKAIVVEGIGKDDSYQKKVKKFFQLGKTYYLRSYVKVKDAIIFGNEVSFTGQRDITPKITECTPTEGLHPIDTIYVKGENFEFYKDKMTAVLFKEYGWDNEKIEMNIKYLDKNTLKVYGPIKEYYKLKIQFDKISIIPNVYFKLNELKNIKIDKKESYSGDTLTLTWENKFDKRDSWSLKINYNIVPQIIEQTDKYIKFKLPKTTWGWSIDFIYNNQKFTENIQAKSPFKDIKVDGELKSGDKILIKTNYPIDESDVYSAYLLNIGYEDQICYYNLKYIDSRTLEYTIPDEATMDKVCYNPDGTVTVILNDYYHYSNGNQLGTLTFNYKTSIGTRIGYFDFYYNIISMIIENNRCNFMVNTGGGSCQLENLSNPEDYPLNLPLYMNGSGIAKDPKSGKIYFTYSHNSVPAEVCVTDEKYHYIETLPFRTEGLVYGFHSSFFYNNKLFFLGQDILSDFGSTIINYRDVYSLDLTTKEYIKEDIILPWKDECTSKIPYYRDNLEIDYIRTHLINDDIFIELLSIGIKSIYKINKSTMQFEYFGDFPNNPNNSKMYSYEFNNKWYVLVDNRVWTFDGSNWTEWAKTPANSTLYFENNGKKYFKVKDFRSLYMLPM